jgi:hypothetical protein
MQQLAQQKKMIQKKAEKLNQAQVSAPVVIEKPKEEENTVVDDSIPPFVNLLNA